MYYWILSPCHHSNSASSVKLKHLQVLPEAQWGTHHAAPCLGEGQLGIAIQHGAEHVWYCMMYRSVSDVRCTTKTHKLRLQAGYFNHVTSTMFNFPLKQIQRFNVAWFQKIKKRKEKGTKRLNYLEPVLRVTVRCRLFPLCFFYFPLTNVNVLYLCVVYTSHCIYSVEYKIIVFFHKWINCDDWSTRQDFIFRVKVFCTSTHAHFLVLLFNFWISFELRTSMPFLKRPTCPAGSAPEEPDLRFIFLKWKK